MDARQASLPSEPPPLSNPAPSPSAEPKEAAHGKPMEAPLSCQFHLLAPGRPH